MTWSWPSPACACSTTKPMDAFERILRCCKVCRIGTADEKGMMIIPMNFGYEIDQDCARLYFHTGPDGRKLRAFRADPRVCFEMDEPGGPVVHGSGEKACDYSYVIHSAMGSGEIAFVEEPHQKQRALELITQHQSGKNLPVPVSSVAHVTVLCLTVSSVTTREKN